MALLTAVTVAFGPLAFAPAAFAQVPVPSAQLPSTSAPDDALQPVPSLGPAIVGTQAAPTTYTAYTPDATRAQLMSRRDSLARFDTTGAAGEARRNELREIHQRLTQGDFTPGDRFLVQDLLLARTTDRPTTGDTVVVREGANGPVFALNLWPEASLQGVLRAELPVTVASYEKTYVREPRIRVVPLTRLSITGGVPRPGYYVVDPDRQFTDAITLAGGPGAAAQKKGRISVFRGSQQIYDPKSVQVAIRDGRTVDELNLRSGDEIRVEPPKKSSFPSAQTIFWGLTAFTGLVALIRSTYNTY